MVVVLESDLLSDYVLVYVLFFDKWELKSFLYLITYFVFLGLLDMFLLHFLTKILI